MLQPRARLVSITLTALVAVWLTAMIVPPVLLLRARSDWLIQLEQPAVQAQWDAFREEMKQQSGQAGPVQRKVPKSAEPPLRVWLRDYLWLAIVAWLLFGSILSFFSGLLIIGVVRGLTSREQSPL
ncbi:MAG: hypothetical protein NT089_03730 [Planctomycetia bacterium]|nr:hypothetical protein [Planctomycetia bacterium]